MFDTIIKITFVFFVPFVVNMNLYATDSFFEQNSAKTPFENPPVAIIEAKPAKHFLLPNPMHSKPKQVEKKQSLLSRLFKVKQAHASAREGVEMQLNQKFKAGELTACLLYTSPSPRD